MLIAEQLSKIIYKSDFNRYYLYEGLLYENPNQAIKYLKEKNLDPAGVNSILDDINNITRGDGYTFLLTKFYVDEKMTLSDLSKLHDYLKQNKEHINRLPKPVVTYNTYNELRDDLENMEGMRAYKKLYNELPTIFKQQLKSISKDTLKKFAALAVKYYKILNPKQKEFFQKKIQNFQDVSTIIEILDYYIKTIENNEDYHSIKTKIENTPDAYIAYENPEKNIIIAYVGTFDASKVLGCTTSWCIARNLDHWEQYKKDGQKYFFIWDFNYSAENEEYLIGTAYNKFDPEWSQTYLKDNEIGNLEYILDEKGLDVKIFNNYLNSNSPSGLINGLTNYDYYNNYDDLINIIQNSNIIQKLGGDVSGSEEDINLGLSSEAIKEMLDLGHEYDDFENYAHSEYSDSYMLHVMYDHLSEENKNLLVDLAKKIGAPSNIYNNFWYGYDEKGIVKFLNDYGLNEIKHIYLYEFKKAIYKMNDEMIDYLHNVIPFDIYNSEFNVKNMLKYINRTNISVDNFDELIELIRYKLPSFQDVKNDYYSGDNFNAYELNDAVGDRLRELIKSNDTTIKINNLKYNKHNAIMENKLNNIISEEIRQIVNNTIYKSDLDRYYIHEGLLYENPNQAIKFLKEKNLDPTTNPNGKEILDDINNITRGDGYTFLLTKFYINERMPIEDLSKLHDYLKQNKEHINRLPKPVVSYNSYNELRNDLDNMEGMRALKKLNNELPINIKQQLKSITPEQQEKMNELGVKYNTLTPEQQKSFMKKASTYDNINVFIISLENYIISAKEYTGVKQKIENTPDADIVYDNPEQNIIIAYIKTFEASTILGCTSDWCVSKNLSHWDSYKKGGRIYFFIWDFNYDSDDINSFVATAYNTRNPSESQTHLKNDNQTNLTTVLNSKHISFDIFNDYIKEFIKNNTNTNTGLMDALNDYNNNNDPLIDIIQNSDIIESLGGNVSGNKNYIELGLSVDQMKEMLDLGDEFDNIEYYARRNSYDHEVDKDELNYIHQYLDYDVMELLIDLAIKIGAPPSLYNNFQEEGIIDMFLDRYNLDSIQDTFLSELSEARGEAEKNGAQELIDKIPFDLRDGDFNVKTMQQYVENNSIDADTFDELIEQIKNNLDDINMDYVFETPTNTDNLNYYIKDKIDDLISDLGDDEDVEFDDDDSEFETKRKSINIIQKVLNKLGFTHESNGFQKEMENKLILIRNFNDLTSSDTSNESNSPYIIAEIAYNPEYYNELGQEIPEDRTVKIPIEKLQNYIDQHELMLENNLNLNKIIDEELNNIFLNQEGVADKYGEKFGLANPDDEMNRIALSGIKQDDMGKFIGTYRNGELNVYLNPKSLNNFDSDVRAVTHIDGNLYIFQTNESGYHSIITFVVNNSKTNDNIGDAYTGKENLTWHRIGKTNDFGLSVSSKFYPQYPEIQQYVIENLKNSRIVNPQFNFIPMYWEDSKKIQYDAKELISKNPYGFKPIDKNTSVEDIYDIIKSNNTYAGLVKYIDSIKKQNPRNLKELTIILATIADEIDNDEYQMYEYKALSELIDRIYRSAL